MANVQRLDKFSEFQQIQSIVDSGNYTHDEAFHLEVGFCYMLTYHRYEKQMYEERYKFYYKEYTRKLES